MLNGFYNKVNLVIPDFNSYTYGESRERKIL